MFIKRMREKRKKKKREAEQEVRQQLIETTGLSFSGEVKGERESFAFMKYFMNAVMLYGAVYGSLFALISSFHLEVNTLIVTAVILFFSLLFSFMYANQKLKLTVYVLILIGSFALVNSFFFVINSGMSAVHNTVLKRIDGVMELPQLREYMEYYPDRNAAMTVAFCVLALAFCLLLNIFISENMNYLMVFLLTFPLVQFGMYFSFDMSKWAMLCSMGSFVLAASIRYSNTYRSQGQKEKKRRKRNRHHHVYDFSRQSEHAAHVAATILAGVMLLYGSMFLLLPQNEFAFSTPFDTWKEKTNQPVKNFLSYGFAAFYHQNSEKAAPGEIANQSSITFDGQVDLKVTLANTNDEQLYLRNFVGQTYLPYNYKWTDTTLMEQEQKEEQENGSTRLELFNQTGNRLAYDYAHAKSVTKAKRKMRISVEDYRLKQKKDLFVPYYTVLEEQSGIQAKTDGRISSSMEHVQTFTYYLQDTAADTSHVSGIFYENGKLRSGAATLKNGEKEYYEKIKEQYLAVPNANLSAIQSFCEKHGLKQGQDDLVNKVIRILEQEYDYTLKPGKDPAGEDFVNYFLTSNKKGYCVHFASAATLIFRYLGIPARYAEGYVIHSEDYDYAVEETEPVSSYIEQEESDSNTDVVTVPLSDSNGHAWVEIYQYDLGWTPVEVTNSASIDDEGSGFFSRLFSGRNTSDTVRAVMNQVDQDNIEKTKFYIMRMIVLLLLLLVTAYFCRMAVVVGRQKYRFFTGSKQQRIYYRENNLRKICEMLQGQQVENLSYHAFSGILCDMCDLTKEEQMEFLNQLEEILFCGTRVKQDAYEYVVGMCKKCKRLMVKQMSWTMRMRYYLIAMLW